MNPSSGKLMGRPGRLHSERDGDLFKCHCRNNSSGRLLHKRFDTQHQHRLAGAALGRPSCDAGYNSCYIANSINALRQMRYRVRHWRGKLDARHTARNEKYVGINAADDFGRGIKKAHEQATFEKLRGIRSRLIGKFDVREDLPRGRDRKTRAGCRCRTNAEGVRSRPGPSRERRGCRDRT